MIEKKYIFSIVISGSFMNKKNEQLPGIIKMVISVEIISFVLLMIYVIFQDRGIHEMILENRHTESETEIYLWGTSESLS